MKKIILKNSIVSLALQLINIGMNFLIRYLLIKYIGVEWLGINATLTSLLSTFSLAELGISSVICFYLYGPIREENNAEINHIINIYRVLYKFIGGIFLTASLLSGFFIPHILTGVAITSGIYAVYFILVITSASTYFLAYRRILLEADQKQYVAKITDIFFELLCGVIQIILLVRLKNYVLFLTVNVFKLIGTNLFVYRKCGRIYPFLDIQKCKSGELLKTVKGMKDVFCIQIASYVYGSTDNLIISIFTSTVYVGYLSNYSMISNTIKSIVRSIMYPLTPIIGNIVAKGSANNEKVFHLCTLAGYALSGMFCIPIIVLTQTFISNIFGYAYLLSIVIPILMVGDIALDIIQIPCCAFIKGSGLFRYENFTCIIGAVTNILFSLILVQKYGMAGVLGGTVLSQAVFFVLRSIVIFKYCIQEKVKEKAVGYYCASVKFFVNFILSSVICWGIYQLIGNVSFIPRFLCGGILCEIVFFLLFAAFWNKDVKDALKIFLRAR